ncbi:MAG: GNAT family N-acetyltransferase [Nanoarchaeota archaeon]
MKDLRLLMNFLASQGLDYRGFDSWLQRSEQELTSGFKQAVVAYNEGKIVGDVVYQPEKNLSGFLEIKNVRIDKNLRMRDFARFMLKQIEVECSGKYMAMIVDARQNNYDFIEFAKRFGFISVANLPLYDKDILDVTMIKPLDRENRGGIISLARKLAVQKAL